MELVAPKPIEDILHFLKTQTYLSKLFETMNPQTLENLVYKSTTLYNYPNINDILFQVGEKTQRIYMVYRGSVAIHRPKHKTNLRKYAPKRQESFLDQMEIQKIIFQGEIEGDLSILNKSAFRISTTINERDTKILVLKVEEHLSFNLQQFIMAYHNPTINYIRDIIIIENLSFLRLTSLVKYAKPVNFRRGDKLFSENDKNDFFVYIILEGDVIISKRKKIDTKIFEVLPVKFSKIRNPGLPNQAHSISSGDSRDRDPTEMKPVRNEESILNKLLAQHSDNWT
jgi:hypothetical protein